MAWTKEQQEAIDLRGSNLLVSAAAGSGKTAVLVERIIKMVCEEGFDIDKILVVTFTKAAAAEMKERIGNRLLEESIKHPENQKIQEQLSYIHRAPISTIHSFCTNLLRNHFHMISLDPGFRIGEEGEVALLKQQVLEELLESRYEKKEEEFLSFVEAYSYGKDDRKIGEMILRLFDYSISHPMPEVWLREALEAMNIEGKEPKWIAKVMEYGDQILVDCISYLEQAMEIAKGTELLAEKYLPFFEEEKEAVIKLRETVSYQERVEAFSAFSFRRIPAIRTKDPDIKEQQEKAKGIRDEVKNMIQTLEKDCFCASLGQIQREAQEIKPYLETLVSLTTEFSELFLQRKLEKNMLEFHDLEHFSLKLLIEDYKDGVVTKTSLARELAKQYQAVFTDEYQDSNLIQEVLLKAVSREEEGNRFMVGDIKQSIYRFRMARPEIFLEKYALGEEKERSLYKNIELKNNFRSRPEVLYSINYIFYQIMKPSLGDVLYEKKVALTPPNQQKILLREQSEESRQTDSGEGKEEQPKEFLEESWKINEEEDFKDSQMKESQKKERITQEIHLLDQEKEDPNRLDFGEISVMEMEAKMVAKRIKELPQYQYRDMVILLRTMEGWAQTFEDVLTMEGIPVHAESRTGYFDTFEIRVLLNLLAVVDNIYQDVEMAAVLRSPIGGFSGEDLACIRSLVLTENRMEDSLYDEMVFYLEKGERSDLKEKITAILDLLSILREEKTRLSLQELIWSALERTDYYHLVGSMPNGQQRMANIRMFLEKAGAYEKTSFKGVFHFLQYMEQIRSYQIDYGEATVLGEEANVVRIMSIHKSKGLEFPVVFLSGLGKMFNFMDRNQRMLLHPDYYIGLDCIDLEKRTKKVSVQKKMIRRQLVLSMLGEELRVLYVAMTRARDKMILTGSVDDFAKWMRNYGERPVANLTFTGLSRGTSYLHWIFPALMRSHSMDAFRESYGIALPEMEYFTAPGEEDAFQLFVTRTRDIFGREIQKTYGKELEKEDFLSWIETAHMNPDKVKEIQKAFFWEYPKKKELKARSKWSVSQLKEEKSEDALFVPIEEKREEILVVQAEEKSQEGMFAPVGEKRKTLAEQTVPKFLQEKNEMPLTGASRGTAIHKLMEELSFVEAEEKGIARTVEELVEKGKYKKAYQNVLPEKKIAWFLQSEIGKRLLQAEKNGKLYKEAQFMIGVPMREMEPETESEELVLLQGVIDLYMEEEDGLVLLDYKTDRVEKGQEQVLIQRYQTQLDWYQRALEQMTGKKVKEKIIYSFTLGKAILL